MPVRVRSSRGSPSRRGKDYREQPTRIVLNGMCAEEFANTIRCEECRSRPWKWTDRRSSRRIGQWLAHLSRHHEGSRND